MGKCQIHGNQTTNQIWLNHYRPWSTTIKPLINPSYPIYCQYIISPSAGRCHLPDISSGPGLKHAQRRHVGTALLLKQVVISHGISWWFNQQQGGNFYGDFLLIPWEKYRKMVDFTNKCEWISGWCSGRNGDLSSTNADLNLEKEWFLQQTSWFWTRVTREAVMNQPGEQGWFLSACAWCVLTQGAVTERVGALPTKRPTFSADALGDVLIRLFQG